MISEVISIKDLSNVIFDLVPYDIQKKYEKNVLGEILTLKDQFISYCESNWKSPRYSKEESKKRVLDILKNVDLLSESFNLDVFDSLLCCSFNLCLEK